MSMFEKPSASDQLDLTTLLNSLLVIRPKAEVTASTAYGEKTAVESDVYVLDGDKSGEVYTNCWLFPLVIQSQLRRTTGTGKFVVGRLTKKPPTRPGTNPAWALADPTAADLDAAEKYAAAHGLTSEPPAPKVEETAGWGTPTNAAVAPF